MAITALLDCVVIGRPGAVIIRDSVVTEAAVVVGAVCKKHVIRMSGFSNIATAV